MTFKNFSLFPSFLLFRWQVICLKCKNVLNLILKPNKIMFFYYIALNFFSSAKFIISVSFNSNFPKSDILSILSAFPLTCSACVANPLHIWYYTKLSFPKAISESVMSAVTSGLSISHHYPFEHWKHNAKTKRNRSTN